MLDLNQAPEHTENSGGGSPIPEGSVVKVRVDIERTQYQDPNGEVSGFGKASNKGNVYVTANYEVLSGRFAGKKIKFDNIGWLGGKDGSYGNRGRAQIRAMVEAGRGIGSKDDSQNAAQGRCINSLEDVCGLEFPVKVGYDIQDNGVFNSILKVITPDNDDPTIYQTVMGGGEIVTDAPVPQPVASAPRQGAPGMPPQGQNPMAPGGGQAPQQGMPPAGAQQAPPQQQPPQQGQIPQQQAPQQGGQNMPPNWS